MHRYGVHVSCLEIVLYLTRLFRQVSPSIPGDNYFDKKGRINYAWRKLSYLADFSKSNHLSSLLWKMNDEQMMMKLMKSVVHETVQIGLRSTFHNIVFHLQCVYYFSKYNAPVNVKPQGGGGGGAGYPREFDSDSFPLGRDFDSGHCPWVGNLTWPPSWMAERTWKWVTAQRISTAFSRCFGVFFAIVFVMSERKVSKFVLFFSKSWPSLIFNLFSCFYKFKRPCFFYFFLDCFLYAFTYSWVYILLSTNMHANRNIFPGGGGIWHLLGAQGWGIWLWLPWKCQNPLGLPAPPPPHPGA